MKFVVRQINKKIEFVYKPPKIKKSWNARDVSKCKKCENNKLVSYDNICWTCFSEPRNLNDLNQLLLGCTVSALGSGRVG